MKFLLMIQLMLIHLLIAFGIGAITGNLSYLFWGWVGMIILFNFVFGKMILFLLEQLAKNKTTVNPVENEEIFDHLFITKKNRSHFLLIIKH